MIISGRTVGTDNNFHFTPIMACYSVLARSKNRLSKDQNSEFFGPNDFSFACCESFSFFHCTFISHQLQWTMMIFCNINSFYSFKDKYADPEFKDFVPVRLIKIELAAPQIQSWPDKGCRY